MNKKKLEELTFYEVLELIVFKEKRFKKISLKKLQQRLTILTYSSNINLLDINLQEETILKSFGEIVTRFKQDKSLELLNSISNIILKEETIAKSFIEIVTRFKQDKALELLESLPLSLKKKTIANSFGAIVNRFNNNKALELLESLSPSLKEETIANSFGVIVNRFNNNKALELLESLPPSLKEKTIANSFGAIVNRFNNNKALELLDSISDNTLQKKAIKKKLSKNKAYKLLSKKFFSLDNLKNNLNSFDIFFKKNSDRAFELLIYSNFTKKEQYQAVNNSFPKLIEIDKQKAYELLEQFFTKKIVDKIIINNTSKLIEVYLQNHKIKNKIFEIIGIVNDKKLKNQLTIDYFDKFFKINSHKAIINLNYLNQNEEEQVIVHHFPKLLSSNKEVSVTLLKRVKNIQKKEEIITKYFEQILQIDSKLAIKLLKDILNKELKDNTIKKFSPLFLQRHHQYIIDLLNLINNNELKEKLLIASCKLFVKNRNIQTLLKLLNYIENNQLKKQIFKETIKTLAQQKEIKAIQKIVNQTQISAIIKEEIKKRYSYLIKEQMNIYINSLNEIQSTLNNEIKESVILDAYTVIQNQESSKEEIDLQKATPEILSHLIISETDKEKHRELFLYLVERLKEDKSKDYSKIAYKTISRSRLFELYLFELEEFVTTIYFKQELKDFKEQKETEQSISKMLGKVLKNPKIKREDVFINRFKQLRKIKDLYVVVPHVAKADFELAQALMAKRIDKGKAQEVQKVIFLNEYQDRWNRAIEVYKRIDDFYIKVDLSKRVLDSFVPDFNSSFFIQAMMILDSQNIAETPNELAVIAPKEVLKYYGEIEDELENALDEIIEQIVNLQRRAKSADEEDDDEWDEIEDEERRIKKVIKADDELYKLFIQRYDMESFRLLSLLKLVIT